MVICILFQEGQIKLVTAGNTSRSHRSGCNTPAAADAGLVPAEGWKGVGWFRAESQCVALCGSNRAGLNVITEGL